MNRRRALSLILAGAGAGCRMPEEPARVQAIIGATMIHRGGAAVEDAVVIVRDGRVWAAGTRAETPIPAGSRKLDARGKYLLPEGEADPIEPGRPASFSLYGADPRSAGALGVPLERKMVDGEWVDPAPSK